MIGAVLLGDLIGSTGHDAAAVDRAMDALRTTAEAIGGIAGQPHFTRYRGDGWQLVTLRPELALRLAVALMARLAADGGPATRIAIGLGRIETLAEGDLGAAAGSAFLRSGQLLDGMTNRRRLMLAGAPAEAAPLLDGLLHLTEFVADGWSPQQAEALGMAVAPGWTVQADLAIRLGISRQAMQLRLKGAGFAPVSTALTAFESVDWSGVN